MANKPFAQSGTTFRITPRNRSAEQLQELSNRLIGDLFNSELRKSESKQNFERRGTLLDKEIESQKEIINLRGELKLKMQAADQAHTKALQQGDLKKAKEIEGEKRKTQQLLQRANERILGMKQEFEKPLRDVEIEKTKAETDLARSKAQANRSLAASTLVKSKLKGEKLRPIEGAYVDLQKQFFTTDEIVTKLFPLVRNEEDQAFFESVIQAVLIDDPNSDILQKLEEAGKSGGASQ